MLLKDISKTPTAAEGFTLIEILVSILLLTIIMAGTLAMQVASLRSTSDSRISSSAMVIAQSRVERFRAVNEYVDLQPTVAPEIACFGPDGRTLCQPPDSCVPGSGPCTSALFTRTTNISSPGDRFVINVNMAWMTREGLRNMGVTMERLP